MVVKNGKAPARRKSASSSAKSSRSNTVPKSGVHSQHVADTDQLDGNIDNGDGVSTESVELTAITLHQPWASLIATGKKQYETRSWGTDYRGPIAIHAGKKLHDDIVLQHLLSVKRSDIPLGAIVAIANITDCILMTEEFIGQQSQKELRCGDWEVGRYAWKLENVRAIEPISATGKQGLWKWNQTQLKVGDRVTDGTQFATISIISKADIYLDRDNGGSVCFPANELGSFGWKLCDAWNPADFGEVQHKAESDGQLNLLEWDVNEPPEPGDYKMTELFKEAYKQWEDSQQSSVNSQQLVAVTARERYELHTGNDASELTEELCTALMDGSICVPALEPASPMPESNCGEEAPTTSASGTNTATQFSEEDIQTANANLATSEQSSLQSHNSAVEYNLSLLARLAPHSQLMESDLPAETIETASPTCLEQSETCSQSLPSSKTLGDCSIAPIHQATKPEPISGFSSTAYTRSGSMQNGKLSAAPTLEAPGVDKESLLLRSPGALSTTKGRPPGLTRLESQLHQFGLIQDGEVVNPEFLEAGYQLPIGFTNLAENRTALELAQQQSITPKSELHQETAITAIDVQPSATLSIGELPLSDSSELNISISLPSNIGALTKVELISMVQEQHQLICVIERKEFELAIEKLHRVRLTGVYLQEFKKKCQYGEFENQLEQAGIGVRSAQQYMVIAKNWEIVEAKAKLVALLTEENQPAIGLKWALETVRDEKKQLKSAAPPKDPDGWRTPNTKDQPVVDLVKQSLGGIIWVDPCSDPSAKVPASVRYFKDDDGLAECNAWTRTVFANPPFSDPFPWVKRCCFEIARGTVSAAVMLLKAGVVSNVGAGELISKYASAVCHWRGRIDFLNDEGNPVKGSDFDCVLVYFGDRLDLFRKAFAGRGTISVIDNHYSSVNKKYQQPEIYTSVAAEERQMAAAVGLKNGRSLLPDMRDADRDLMERHDPSTVFENMPTVFTSIEQPEISAEIQSISAEFQQAKSDCLSDYITAISGNISAFSDEQIAFLARIINEESAKRIDF